MRIIIASGTNCGNDRDINQDSFLVRQMHIDRHRVVSAILCDGMGGTYRGEVASASVVKSFDRWIDNYLVGMIRENVSRDELRKSWKVLLDDISGKLYRLGDQKGRTGTTAVILLVIDELYFILNVGDSRVYRFSKSQSVQITEDQTMFSRDIRNGKITAEKAAQMTGANTLLQAVGTTPVCVPDLYAGRITEPTVFMMCSDGFRNMISMQEFKEAFVPDAFQNKLQMKMKIEDMIELNRKRGEKDNISAILVKAF